MTNYVTGLLPEVEPQKDMKIAVGALIAAVTLQDLKDFITGSTSTGNNGTDNYPLTDVTIPSDAVIYIGSPNQSNVQFSYNPIGSNTVVTVTEITSPNLLKTLSYDQSSRVLTATGNTEGTATVRVSWNNGKSYKDIQIPVKQYDSGSGNTGGNSGGNTTPSMEDWDFSPNKDTVSLDTLTTTGIQTWARRSGSGAEVVWTRADNFDLSNFDISANETGSGQQTLKLKSKDSFPYGGDIILYATSQGIERSYTLTITR